MSYPPSPLSACTLVCALLALAPPAWAQSSEPSLTVTPAPGEEPAEQPSAPPEPPSEPEPPPAPSAPVSDASAQVEVVVVRGRRLPSEAEAPEAVHIVNLEPAQGRTADLGEVLARSSGISVRRSGGLGSATRFSLHGLSGERVRFFVDGVPLALAGYPFGVANVPVSLVEHVAVYRGVVPVALGADALGGAVDLVTTRTVRKHRAEASYQGGSFGTHRLASTFGTHHAASGTFLRGAAFLDRARNDYEVNVSDLDSETGRERPARLPRFHDAYHAHGAQLEAGVSEKPWADELRARLFYALHERELQSGPLMTVPFGEAEYGRRSLGAQVHLRERFGDTVRLDGVLGYTHNRTLFTDLSTCRYDWRGRCVARLPTPGEVFKPGRATRISQDALYGRMQLVVLPHPDHVLRLALAPTYVMQDGRDRALSRLRYDPLTAERNLLAFVAGLEHESTLFDERLTNVVFAKAYTQRLDTAEELPNGRLRDVARTSHRFGAGDSLRVTLLGPLYAKASYEYAVRLPTADEVFGDGGLTIANLRLEPEASHNANLTVGCDDQPTAIGSLRGRVDGFARFTRELIQLTGGEYFQYVNVHSARTLGVEAAAGYTSPGEYVSLDGNVTFQDPRNTASRGPFSRYEGDRIPNQPTLLANGGAVLRKQGLTGKGDVLELSWDTRYVQGFRRGWESRAPSEGALRIPTQLTHAAALTHTLPGKPLSVQSTLEVQNLTDARVFDFFGAERPGRSVFFKLTLSL